MAQQQPQGQPETGNPQQPQGQRPFTPGEVGKLAAVAAMLVFVGETILELLIEAIEDSPARDLGAIIESQLTGVPYDGFLFAAVLWVALAQGEKDSLLKGSALAYAGSFIGNIFSLIIFDLEADVGTFFNPVYAVFTVLGIGMVIRLYHGKTILPGVDVTL